MDKIELLQLEARCKSYKKRHGNQKVKKIALGFLGATAISIISYGTYSVIGSDLNSSNEINISKNLELPKVETADKNISNSEDSSIFSSISSFFTSEDSLDEVKNSEESFVDKKKDNREPISKDTSDSFLTYSKVAVVEEVAEKPSFSYSPKDNIEMGIKNTPITKQDNEWDETIVLSDLLTEKREIIENVNRSNYQPTIKIPLFSFLPEEIYVHKKSEVEKAKINGDISILINVISEELIELEKKREITKKKLPVFAYSPDSIVIEKKEIAKGDSWDGFLLFDSNYTAQSIAIYQVDKNEEKIEKKIPQIVASLNSEILETQKRVEKVEKKLPTFDFNPDSIVIEKKEIAKGDSWDGFLLFDSLYSTINRYLSS